MKSEADFNFLVDFVRDNRQVINTCNTLLLNKHSLDISKDIARHDSPLFSPKGDMFWSTIIVGCSAIGFVVCSGIFYEWYRTKKNSSSCEEEISIAL